MTEKKVNWSWTADYIQGCNCDWGCPCNFNAPPTKGHCEGMAAWHIRKGRYGKFILDGFNCAVAAKWPGQIHEGNGTAAVYIDDRANLEQRDALVMIMSGQAGGLPFELIATTFSTLLKPRYVSIDFRVAGKDSSITIGKLMNVILEPMRNPVTRAIHEAQIVLPNGFIFTKGATLNTKECVVNDGPLSFSYPGKNGHYAVVKYSGP